MSLLKKSTLSQVLIRPSLPIRLIILHNLWSKVVVVVVEVQISFGYLFLRREKIAPRLRNNFGIRHLINFKMPRFTKPYYYSSRERRSLLVSMRKINILEIQAFIHRFIINKVISQLMQRVGCSSKLYHRFVIIFLYIEKISFRVIRAVLHLLRRGITIGSEVKVINDLIVNNM